MVSKSVMGSRRQDAPSAATASAVDPQWGEIGALLLAVMAGPLCWALWVWPSINDAGYLPESGYAGFFATLALIALAVGALGGLGSLSLVLLSIVSYVSAMATVFFWWSQDETGLFMVGIIMLALPVLAGAFIFVAAGRGAMRALLRRREGQR